MSAIRLHWLDWRGDRALLMHALLGDELRLPGPDNAMRWLAPVSVSRGERILLLTYVGGAESVGLCAIAPNVSPDWVRALRAELGPQGAERRWGPFVAQLGRFPNAAEAAAASEETELLHRGQSWRARRARHPSPLIERLSLRDRIEAEELLAAAMGGGALPMHDVEEQRTRIS
ncbi:MAG: hypothetical protein AB7P07_04390 [Hyphomonadaceae bacterium]